MPQSHKQGMDHDHYSYSPIPTRPRLRWKNGAGLAIWAVIYLEYWEISPPDDAYKDPRHVGPFGSFFPDYRTHSVREYGNRIGIFRILDLLDRYNIPVSIAVNSAACDRYPKLLEDLIKRGSELIAHGTHATRMITSGMSKNDERAHVEQSANAIKKLTGKQPSGWISQDFGESTRTPQIVADAGFKYIADWPNDDQPYFMTPARTLVSIPYHVELDDVTLNWIRQVASQRYPQIIDDAASTLREEGKVSARTMSLGIHPWLLGQPHRIRYLGEALSKLRSHEDIWFATGEKIADAFLSQQSPPSTST